jgi:uncharacterized membrane protein
MSEAEEKRGWLRAFGWGKIVLILSLALNLLFIGSMVGARWMNHPHGSRWGGPPDSVVKRMLKDLPEAKQNAILELVISHREAQKPRIKELREQKQALRTALRSEQFNADDIRQAAEKFRASRVAMGESKTELLIKALALLSPDERREILKKRVFRRLLRNKDRRWRRSHHKN